MFRRITQIGALALALTCTAAFAGQSPFSAIVPIDGVPVEITDANRPQTIFNAADLRIELDGKLVTADELIASGKNVHVVVDSTGAASGFHSADDAKAFNQLVNGQCTKADRSPTACAFCTGLNLTGSCFAVPCGTGINLNFIRSFVTGCAITQVCTGATFTGSCFAFTGAPERAINANITLRSGGCAN